MGALRGDSGFRLTEEASTSSPAGRKEPCLVWSWCLSSPPTLTAKQQPDTIAIFWRQSHMTVRRAVHHDGKTKQQRLISEFCKSQKITQSDIKKTEYCNNLNGRCGLKPQGCCRKLKGLKCYKFGDCTKKKITCVCLFCQYSPLNINTRGLDNCLLFMHFNYITLWLNEGFCISLHKITEINILPEFQYIKTFF